MINDSNLNGGRFLTVNLQYEDTNLAHPAPHPNPDNIIIIFFAKNYRSYI